MTRCRSISSSDEAGRLAETRTVAGASKRLRRAGRPVEYVLYTDEGHGFARPENRLHFNAKTEEFLAKYLGGRCEPLGEIKGHSGVVK